MTTRNSLHESKARNALVLKRLREWVAHNQDESNGQEYPQLTAREVEDLLCVEQPQAAEVLDLAAALRDLGLRGAQRSGIITYSKKAFLPITNLCRDKCHYCTFVETPNQLKRQNKSLFMPPERVLAIARQAAALGCKEALFTLGDRPEDRWPEAQAWLDEHGFKSTLDYVKAMATLVREETGLLPHLNPGVMTAQELSDLRPHAPSMGMMLETTSEELWAIPGKAHFGSPDKDPLVRLKVLEDAGVAKIPFTTGILVGIGETIRDRAMSILALNDIQNRHGHLQEIIVQNFRAKPATAMQSSEDLDITELLLTIAVTRLVFGPNMRIQAPPNLAHARELELLLAAGIDDWGGVSPLTADHVNPERPWPSIEQLAKRTARAGFELRERLTTYPRYLTELDTWVDPVLHESVSVLTDKATYLADEKAQVGRALRSPQPIHIGLRSVFGRASNSPETLRESDLTRLLLAEGSDLEELCRLADDLRRYTVGETVSYVENRAIDLHACAQSQELANVAHDAVTRGLSELCIQGHSQASKTSVHESPNLVRIAHEISSAEPNLHLHAFRPAEIALFSEQTQQQLEHVLRELKSVGVLTIPGTGVPILGDDLASRSWIDIIRVAHLEGIRSTSVIGYGDGESPLSRVRHLRTLSLIHAETQGFTECVLMPAPGDTFKPLISARSRSDEHRAMVAVARLMLNANISRIQAAWTRLTFDELVAALQSGANDIGGTLHDGSVMQEASAERGRSFTPQRLDALSAKLMRSMRQRNTTYEEVGSTQPFEASA